MSAAPTFTAPSASTNYTTYKAPNSASTYDSLNVTEVTFGPPLYPVQTPIFASVELTIGDYKLSPRPNNIVSFEHHDFLQGIGKFKLVIADPAWAEIETNLNKHQGQLSIKYGYLSDTPTADGLKNTLVSPVFKCLALRYNAQPMLQVNVLTISGLTTGYDMNLAQGFKKNEFTGLTIKQIIEKIAELSNIQETLVEPCSFVDRNDMVSTDLQNGLFTALPETYLQTIITKLKELAVNEAGQGNFNFFIGHNKETGKPVLHFHTLGYKPQEEASGKDNVYAFTRFGSPYTPVTDFEPNWNMSLVQILGGNSVSIGGTDTITGATFNQQVTTKDSPQELIGTTNGVAIRPPPTTDYESASHDLGSTGNSREESVQKVRSLLSGKWLGALTADLTIMGTPFFQLLDRIIVIIYMPQGTGPTLDLTSVGLNAPGAPYWVSGEYFIRGIVHSILGGDYKTKFRLVTSGRNVMANVTKVPEGTKKKTK